LVAGTADGTSGKVCTAFFAALPVALDALDGDSAVLSARRSTGFSTRRDAPSNRERPEAPFL
jgi:hypothetical protein